MYDLTLRAFNLSERFRVPTFVMAEEAVGHLRGEHVFHPSKQLKSGASKEKGEAPFGTDEEDRVPPMPTLEKGNDWLLVTGSTHDPFGYRKTDDGEVRARLSRTNQ